MNTPEKCPKCGAVNLRFIDRNTSQFKCGSVSRNGTVVVQTSLCTNNERDQLTTKLTALESSYAECAEKLHCAEQREHVLKRRLEYYTRQRDRLAERVKRLEKAGRELCKRHLLVVVTYPRAQEDVAEYEKAIQ